MALPLPVTPPNYDRKQQEADFANQRVTDRQSSATEKFDAIVCSNVLYHLDLDHAYPEPARVLKPDGKILCIEAIGHNPVIRLYRKKNPRLRTPWEVGHILKRKDLRKASTCFDSTNVRFFHLCSIAAVPLRRSRLFFPLLSVCEGVDSLLLRVPELRRWTWQMVFELSGPRKERIGTGREAA